MIGQYGINNPFFMYQGTTGLSLPTEGDKPVKLTSTLNLTDIVTSPAECGTVLCGKK